MKHEPIEATMHDAEEAAPAEVPTVHPANAATPDQGQV